MKIIPFLALTWLVLSCSFYKTHQRDKVQHSCTCDLTELEVIQQDSTCWSRAGITNLFVPSQERPLRDTLSPLSEIQIQLDQLAQKGGGTLIVPKGRFAINAVVRIPSNVSLVGISPQQSIFEIKLKETFDKSRHWMSPKGNSAAFIFDHSVNSSIENLTLLYNPVDFEPLDFDDFDHPWVREVFHEDDKRAVDLFVTTVWFEHAENCLLTNCKILNAGNDPIRIRNSRHITCSHNTIDRAYNKSGGGAGYYNLINSSYCLLYKETVSRIRHLSIHKSSSYNVVYGCDLEVDVNFHNGDLGHNLIENNQIRIPHWHSWRCFGTGDPSQHLQPGPFNVLFKNYTDYKGTGYETDPTVLYFMANYFPDRSKGESKLIATDFAQWFRNGIYDPTAARRE